MIQMRTPFAFKKDTDDQELAAIKKQAEEAFTVVGDRARKCLNNDDFKAYRKDYLQTEAKVLDALLKYNTLFHKTTGGNITDYAMVVARYLTKLESLRSLLEAVAKDAQKDLIHVKS